MKRLVVGALLLLAVASALAGETTESVIAGAAAKKAEARLDRLHIPKESPGHPRLMLTLQPNGFSGVLVASNLQEASKDVAAISAACRRATEIAPVLRDGTGGGVPAVRFAATSPRPFQLRISNRSDIGAFIRSLGESKIEANGVLAVPDGIEVSGLPAVSMRDEALRCYDLSELRSSVIATDYRVSPIAIAEVAGITLTGIFVQFVLIGLMLHALFAKGIERNQRRETAYRYMVASMMLAIGGAIALAPVALRLGPVIALSALWMSGPVSAVLLSGGWLVGLPSPLLFAALSGKALGPNPAVIPSKSIDPKAKRARLVGNLVGASIVVLVYAGLEMVQHSELGFAAALGIGLVFGAIHAGEILFTTAHARYARDELTEDSVLTDKLAADAARLSLRPRKVKVARGPAGSTQLRVDLVGRDVVVTEKAIAELTPDELRFLLVSNGLDSESAALNLALLPLLGVPIGLAYLLTRLGRVAMVAVPTVFLVSMAIVLGVWYLVATRVNAKRRMSTGLRATLNPVAASSALGKIAGPQPTKSQSKTLTMQCEYLVRAATDQGLHVDRTQSIGSGH